MRTVRWSTTSLLVLVLSSSSAVWQPPDAGAAVACQRKNKVRLRAERCKEKETPLFDTGEVGVERERVNAHDARLDEHEGRLDEQEGRLDDDEDHLGRTEAALIVRCDGDPTRRQLVYTLAVGGSIARCRTLDGDPEACGQAFQLGLFGQPEACVHLQGNCLGCDLLLNASGLCQNTCQSFSCADATRAPSAGCVAVSSEDDCNQSWGFTFDFPTPERPVQATSCLWNEDESDCEDCDPEAISQNRCQNTCLTPEQFPRCRAEGRTYGACEQLDGNEADCNLTYQVTDRGTVTCWYDAGDCEPCDPVSEGEGSCSNDC